MSNDCPCGDIKSCLSDLSRAMSMIEDIHDGPQRIVVDAKVERNQRPRTLQSKETGGDPKVIHESP